VASHFKLVVGIRLLVPALHFSVWLKCLLHLSASQCALGADRPVLIHLARFEDEVYGCCITGLQLGSHAKFTGWSSSSFPELPECLGTEWNSVAMPCGKRFCTLQLMHITSPSHAPGSRCSIYRIAACELLTTATILTPCF